MNSVTGFPEKGEARTRCSPTAISKPSLPTTRSRALVTPLRPNTVKRFYFRLFRLDPTSTGAVCWRWPFRCASTPGSMPALISIRAAFGFLLLCQLSQTLVVLDPPDLAGRLFPTPEYSCLRHSVQPATGTTSSCMGLLRCIEIALRLYETER